MSAMTEKILNLTLEIIYLLTGEDHIVVKKSDHDSRGCIPGEPSQSAAPVTNALLFSLSHNRNDKKILKITNKIIELLSGEEWEYSERHEDPYKDAATDSQQQPIGSEGCNNERNPAKSCGSVPGSEDCTGEEDRTGTPDHQQGGENRTPQHKVDEPELDLISAVLSVSCAENTPNPPPASPPSDCPATCVKSECYPADRPSSPTSSQMRTRSVAVQDEERPSDRQVKTAAESVTERLRAQYSYTTPSKRRKGNPFPLKKEAKSPVPVAAWEADLPKDLDDTANMEDTSQTAYQCSQCQESFDNAADFFTHQALHKAESWFPPFYHPVSFVGMDFSGKQKPFVCLDCGKCFMYRSAFTRHQRIHTGEKPFVCSECGKCFSQNTHLAKHRKNHGTIA